MEISGVPAHVLIVHAAVVFTPLAVLATIAFALVPSWRYLLRWPTVVLTAVAFVAIIAARVTGEDLKETFAGIDENNPVIQAINDHQAYANGLALTAFVLLLLVLLGAGFLGGRSGLASGRGERALAARWIELALPVALVAVAVLVAVYVVLTGDAGAKAVWNPNA